MRLKYMVGLLCLATTVSFADHLPAGNLKKQHRRVDSMPAPFRIPHLPPASSTAFDSSSLEHPTATASTPSTAPTTQRSPATVTEVPLVLQGNALQILPQSKANLTHSISPSASNQQQKTAGVIESKPLLMGYYVGWAIDVFPPEKVDFSRYDWIDFAFAVPTAEFGLAWDEAAAPGVLTRLVTAAHLRHSKVKLSIGGWTGSKHFSAAVSTAERRELLAKDIFEVYSLYDLDGIDLDWEYPGHEGNKGNTFHRSDTANLLSFLTDLRSTLPPSAVITAAVQAFPFADENGSALSDTSAFARVLDWVVIMNYDTWGSSTSPGPNAPLYDSCGNSTQPESSALAGYKAWTASGFPVSKLVMGLPSYGYVQHSGAQRLRNRNYFEYRGRHREHGNDNAKFSADRLDHSRYSGGWDPDHEWAHGGQSGGYGHGDVQWGSQGGNSDNGDDEGADEGHGTPQQKPSGSGPPPLEIVEDEEQIQFRELVKQGALTRAPMSANDTYPRYLGSGGFERRWDPCSETPFLRSEFAGQVVTYDDPESLALKARFAKEVGLLGVNMFDVHGDTDDYVLIDSVRTAMGLAKPPV